MGYVFWACPPHPATKVGYGRDYVHQHLGGMARRLGCYFILSLRSSDVLAARCGSLAEVAQAQRSTVFSSSRENPAGLPHLLQRSIFGFFSLGMLLKQRSQKCNPCSVTVMEDAAARAGLWGSLLQCLWQMLMYLFWLLFQVSSVRLVACQ